MPFPGPDPQTSSPRADPQRSCRFCYPLGRYNLKVFSNRWPYSNNNLPSLCFICQLSRTRKCMRYSSWNRCLWGLWTFIVRLCPRSAGSTNGYSLWLSTYDNLCLQWPGTMTEIGSSRSDTRLSFCQPTACRRVWLWRLLLRFTDSCHPLISCSNINL